MGLIYFSQGRYTQALHHFDTANQRYGKQSQIRYNRTLALLKLGRIEEAYQELAIIEKLEAGQDGIYGNRVREIMEQL